MGCLTLDNGARLIVAEAESCARCVALGGNFIVEWMGGKGPDTVRSGQEMILIFTAGAGTGAIDGPAGHLDIAPMSVALVPPGDYRLSAAGSRSIVVLATDRPDIDRRDALNPGEARDSRIAPIGAPFVRRAPLPAPLIAAIDDIAPPEDNPRLRFLQSATMSINLVLYDGPRGRKALSPHAHTDIEQGSLAIEGEYVHHLRTPWGRDADKWIDDAHLEAGPGTLLLIPPELVHTTEGVGGDSHFLIDIFAPPRRDFIAKQWVSNAGDYADPAG